MLGEGNNRGRQLFLLVLLIVLVLLVIFLWPRRAASQLTKTNTVSVDLEKLPESFPPIPQLVATPDDAAIRAKSAILIDIDSGTVLYTKQPQTPLPIASTTKLMTALLTRKHLALSTVVAVTKEDVSVIGSDIQLRTGEEISVESLLEGLLLNSGNDAAAALGRTAAGSIEAFVAMMNTEASALGMKYTHYLDPAGLEDAGLSTAGDLSIVSRAVLRDPILAKIIQTKEKIVTSSDGRIIHRLKNSNHLVGDMAYPGVIGFKTGFTPDAGHCLVAGAERGGHRLLAVILHTDADTITASAIEARKLMDWGWQNTRWD